MADRRYRRGLGVVAWHLVMLGAILAMIFPVIWAIVTSFKPPNELYSLSLIASHPTLDNYTYALTKFPIVQLLSNTFIMAAGVALGQIVIAILGAFALAHFAPRGRNLILILVMISLALPPQALLIPQFLMVARLGWLNTEAGLIIPQLGLSALPVLLFGVYVANVPSTLSDAARLDGARHREILWHVILPGLRPAIASVTILVFINTWNEYVWPLIVGTEMDHTTIQIGLRLFQTAEGSAFGGLLAAATLTSLPIVAVYLVASRRITDAFLQTGLK